MAEADSLDIMKQASHRSTWKKLLSSRSYSYVTDNADQLFKRLDEYYLKRMQGGLRALNCWVVRRSVDSWLEAQDMAWTDEGLWKINHRQRLLDRRLFNPNRLMSEQHSRLAKWLAVQPSFPPSSCVLASHSASVPTSQEESVMKMPWGLAKMVQVGNSVLPPSASIQSHSSYATVFEQCSVGTT